MLCLDLICGPACSRVGLLYISLRLFIQGSLETCNLISIIALNELIESVLCTHVGIVILSIFKKLFLCIVICREEGGHLQTVISLCHAAVIQPHICKVLTEVEICHLEILNAEMVELQLFAVEYEGLSIESKQHILS